MSAINTALSSLRAFTIKMDVTSNNIANINTDGFKKSVTTLQEQYPSGVSVTIKQDNSPGIIIKNSSDETRELSNVNLHDELTNLITTQYAYNASTITIKVANEMNETLLDILA